jgi:hypothetical protein
MGLRERGNDNPSDAVPYLFFDIKGKLHNNRIEVYRNSWQNWKKVYAEQFKSYGKN